MNLKNNDMFMVEVGTHVRMGFNKVHEVAKRKKSHSGDSGDWPFWRFAIWRFASNLGEQNGFT